MKTLSVLVLALTGLAIAGCADSDSARLKQLFDDQLEFSLQEHPLFATFYGDHRFDDKLPKVSEDDIKRRFRQQVHFLERLNAIDPNALSSEEKINYDIFKLLRENGIKWHRLKSYLMPISHMGGFHTHFAQLGDELLFNTAKDYENYIARLNAFEQYTQGHIDLMRKGIEKHLMPPKIILEQIPKTIESIIVEDVNDSTLFEPFKKYPPIISRPDRLRLTSSAIKAIKESVMPAYRKLLKFINEEYIPAGRDDIAVCSLPNGKEYYKHCIYHYTTLKLEPGQIHQTGLAEIERIRQEMNQLIEQTGFDGDFNSFKEFLHTDKQFYVDTPEQLLKEVAYILKKADGKLPEYFSRLPRMPVGIKEVPKYIEEESATAYYSPPTMDKTKAGFYYINTFDAKSSPLHGLTATALHETNPGHHLQISLQHEIEDMPAFRRLAHFTAYTEGWALYAEWLGLEMGVYEDDYSKFGRGNNEMWRACRLVVDTGIHYFGWSRQQAIDFMAKHTSLNKNYIETEVDRYIVWPGQALAYKIGELKIRELRSLAQQQLGENFDIRQFHDIILKNGAIPLDMLEKNVNMWISKQQAGKNCK